MPVHYVSTLKVIAAVRKKFMPGYHHGETPQKSNFY
jgi:hypothetical protein